MIDVRLFQTQIIHQYVTKKKKKKKKNKIKKEICLHGGS